MLMEGVLPKTPSKSAKQLTSCFSPVKITSEKRIRFGSMATVDFNELDPSTKVSSSAKKIIANVNDYDKLKDQSSSDDSFETSRNSIYLSQFDNEPDIPSTGRRSSVRQSLSLSMDSDSDNQFLNNLVPRETRNPDELDALLRDSDDDNDDNGNDNVERKGRVNGMENELNPQASTTMQLNALLNEGEAMEISDDDNDDNDNDNDNNNNTMNSTRGFTTTITTTTTTTSSSFSPNTMDGRRRSTRLTTLLREEAAKQLLEETSHTTTNLFGKMSDDDVEEEEELLRHLHTHSASSSSSTFTANPSSTSSSSRESARLTTLLREEMEKDGQIFVSSSSSSSSAVSPHTSHPLTNITNPSEPSTRRRSSEVMDMSDPSNPSSMMMDAEETATLQHLLDGSMENDLSSTKRISQSSNHMNDMNEFGTVVSSSSSSSSSSSHVKNSSMTHVVDNENQPSSMMDISDASELPLVQDLLDNPLFNPTSSASTTTLLPAVNQAKIPEKSTPARQRVSFGFDDDDDEEENGTGRRSRRSTLSLTDMQAALLRELDKYDRRSSLVPVPPSTINTMIDSPTTTSTMTPLPSTTMSTLADGRLSEGGHEDGDGNIALTNSLPVGGLMDLVQAYEPSDRDRDRERGDGSLMTLTEKEEGEEGIDELNTTMELQMLADQLREELRRDDDDNNDNNRFHSTNRT